MLKLTKEEFSRSLPKSELDNFLIGIRSQETKKRYKRKLEKILCDTLEDFFEGNFEQRVRQFVKMAKDNPDWTQDLLLNFSKKLRERTQLPKDDKNYLNPSGFKNWFNPLKMLLKMNNVPFAWGRINASFPELDNLEETRGWKREEIQRMLKFSIGAKDRAIILVASSSGIRAGGFVLHWEDVVPIYRIDGQLRSEITESEEKIAEFVCAMLVIYKGSNHSYFAFITPEAYQAVLDYKKEWTNEVGRDPRPQDPLFIKDGGLPRIATTSSIAKRVRDVLERSGLRVPLPKGKKRHEVPAMNGFRRFWNKTMKETIAKDSRLSALIRQEFMMGHFGLLRLDRNYFKTHFLELAEEYVNAVPNLTISDEFRLKERIKQKDDLIKRKEIEKRVMERGYQNKIDGLEHLLSSVLKRVEKLESQAKT